MQTYTPSYQRRKKSNTRIVMWALIASWLIIFIGIWRVFFRSKPTPPTNLIDGSIPITGDTVAIKPTYYMGEKILAAGTLTPTETFTTYTHDFVSDKGDVFGLKSKDVDLYTFEDKVQLKGTITDFKDDLPIISVTEIIVDTANQDTTDIEVDENPDYYLFEDKGIGFDLSISEGYSVESTTDGNIVLLDDANGSTEVMTINTILCTPGDSLKDCVALEKRFEDIGSDSFISSNGIKFYNLTETTTRLAFHPSGKYGYYISPKDENNFTAFVNLMSFVDEDKFVELITEKLPDICKNLDYNMEEIEEANFVYGENGVVKGTLISTSNDGATLTCLVALRLGNNLKITPLSFVSEGGTGIVEEPVNNEDDSGEESVNSDEATVEEQEAIIPPSNTTSALPTDWETTGRFKYSSVRGYDVYFSNKSISYAGDILEEKTDLGVTGLSCNYKVNVIQWKNADQIDTNPDVEIYECVGSMDGAVDLQKVGETDDNIFVAKWYTNNLGDMNIVVE